MVFYDFEVFEYDWLVVILDMINKKEHVIINDSDELKAFFDKYYYYYDFYLFGLNKDYRRYPFKLMGSAMALADNIKIIGGYCDICGQEPSKYSLRLENDKPADIDKEGQVILLDGEYEDVKIDYKSICDDCWRKIYRKG